MRRGNAGIQLPHVGTGTPKYWPSAGSGRPSTILRRPSLFAEQDISHICVSSFHSVPSPHVFGAGAESVLLQQLPQLHPARARWAQGNILTDAHVTPMQAFTQLEIESGGCMGNGATGGEGGNVGGGRLVTGGGGSVGDGRIAAPLNGTLTLIGEPTYMAAV